MPKRKKPGDGKRRQKGKAKRKQPKVVPGYTRTTGYYGRYDTAAGGELKFHDVDLDDAVIAIGGSIATSLITIAQGVTESQRIGRKCTIRSINCRFEVSLPGATAIANTSDIVRCIIFLDKQANGVTPSITGVLESADYQSFNNLANKGRFRTLMDRTYNLSAKAGSGRGSTDTLAFGEIIIEDTFFKNCNIPIEYDSTTGAITEMRSNNISIILLSKSGLAGFNSKFRFRFDG